MKRLFLLLFLLVPAFCEAQPSVIYTTYPSAAPTTDNGVAYASGDLIGGKLTFTGSLRSNVGTGQLTSVRISDSNKQAADLELVLFSDDPSSTTFANNSAFDIAAADRDKVVAIISLGSTARFAYSVTGIVYLGNLLIPVRAIGSTSGSPQSTLYGALVSRGTPTYTSTSALSIRLSIVND